MAWNFWRSSEAQTLKVNAADTKRPVMDEDSMRTVARRRLIGAAVLVLLTVLIFPWVFKQQPRPLNDDLVIEVPRKEAAKPMALPSNTASPSSTSSAAAVTTPSPAPSPATATAAAATSTKPEAKPEVKPEAKPEAEAKEEVKKPATAPPASEPAPPVKKETKPAAKEAVAADEDKNTSASSSASGRFVVQVAAFADAAKAREVRIKLESQGYKTYSQSIDSPKGKVWRVRLGPYDNKAEADKAKAQMVSKGFQPALLEL